MADRDMTGHTGEDRPLEGEGYGFSKDDAEHLHTGGARHIDKEGRNQNWGADNSPPMTDNDHTEAANTRQASGVGGDGGDPERAGAR